ncbi:MAG TPA: CAP domain-containing protein [Thermoanaerobaculia bacterium]|nr:CAP domain-containing protein [Thermoanaerobaculia bacterium]
MKKLMVLVVAAAASLASASEITPQSVLEQLNVRRVGAGLGPLRIDDRLAQAAEDRIRDMEEQGYWAHVGPDGRPPFQWLKPRGYEFAFAGENLAAGFETAEVMVESWMESKGHRANILSPLYQDCGIAFIEGSTTGRSVGRSVVVLFARPMVMSVATNAAK